jgi:cell division protein ZapA (FtsZ GTPase activity inhibitor)
MSVQIVHIDLLGTSFTIQTDESLDYMEEILARLRERLSTLSTQTKVSDPLKLSILANITILDELLRARTKGVEPTREGPLQARAAIDDEVERVTARLIADLDRSLDSPPD